MIFLIGSTGLIKIAPMQAEHIWHQQIQIKIGRHREQTSIKSRALGQTSTSTFAHRPDHTPPRNGEGMLKFIAVRCVLKASVDPTLQRMSAGLSARFILKVAFLGSRMTS